MRLIDADRAMEIVRDQGIAHPNAYHLTNYATLILREAPTVDAVEVVRRWKCKYYEDTMMDVRGKLVELLRNSPHLDTIKGYKGNDCTFEQGADWLIANGVTVQEWVSVADRLPEEKGRYLTANKRFGDKIVVFDLWFGGGFWYVDEEDNVFDFEVTHWMPLPNPPKGE